MDLDLHLIFKINSTDSLELKSFSCFFFRFGTRRFNTLILLYTQSRSPVNVCHHVRGVELAQMVESLSRQMAPPLWNISATVNQTPLEQTVKQVNQFNGCTGSFLYARIKIQYFSKKYLISFFFLRYEPV